MTSFESDVNAYQRALPKLLEAHEGKFVLLRHAEVVGIFESQAAAMKAGYARYGLKEFLTKEVMRADHDMLVGTEPCPT
ncbi:MAG: hypothetical protein V4739_17220 [Pseudomonadota bacterium]